MTDPLERPERLSQTFLRRWKQCPRLAHLERQVGPSSDVAVIGSVCHSIFAAVGMATALEGHTKPSPARAEHIAMHYLASPDAAGLSREDHETVLSLVRRWAPDAEFQPDERFEVLYRTPLLQWMLSAKVDRLRIVGDRAFVRDYKTGWGKTHEAPTVQGDIYAWHVLMNHPEVDVVEYDEDWVRFGGVIGQPFEYWREHINRVDEWLRAKIAAIEETYAEGELPATPGHHCQDCPDPVGCPLPERLRKREVLADEDAALEELAALFVEEARITKRGARLRAFVDARGVRALAVGGREIGYAKQAGTSLDSRALAQAGIDLAPFRKDTPPSWGRRKAS
jgi:hypothetical protein